MRPIGEGMRSWISNRRRAIVVAFALAVPLGAGVFVARSPRLRASFSAAYRAFKEPSLVDAPMAASGGDTSLQQEIELAEADLSSDFEIVNPSDLADAGDATIASLTFPDLPIPISRRTMRYVAYFAESERGRSAFLERFRRGGRYRAHVEQALRDAELPEDLVWLLAIESGFNPQATSPKGAAGLFQFMPKTAARYGLAQSEFLDERRSITRSTAAGVAYLRDLFARYGAWDLALAAYNFGEERLDESLERFKSRRSKRDANKAIELKDLIEAKLIPRETANFVPLIQAFALVAVNRGRFGLDELDPVAPFELGEIAVPAGTELRLVARAAGVPLEVIRDYNPDLLRPSLPPEGADLIVLIPADRVSRTRAVLPTLLAANAAASASAAAASASASASPSSVASASAKPAESAPPRVGEPIELSKGVELVCEGEPSALVKIEASVALGAKVRRGFRPSGKVLRIEPIELPQAELGRGLERAASAVRALVVGEAARELRQRAARERRKALARVPYGTAWLALGEQLFPKGHALEGAALAGPLLPQISVAITEAEPTGGVRVGLQLRGVSPKIAEEKASHAFAKVLEPAPLAALPEREERVTLRAKVPSPRLLVGWIAPPADAEESAAMRLATLVVAHDRFGRVARALVSDSRVAVTLRGVLEHFEGGSVVALEAMPSVKHDCAAVERELDKAIAALSDKGPSAEELAQAKEQLRARLEGDRSRAGATGEPREVVLGRIDKLRRAANAVSAAEVQALIARVFARDHRVVVVTEPER